MPTRPGTIAVTSSRSCRLGGLAQLVVLLACVEALGQTGPGSPAVQREVIKPRTVVAPVASSGCPGISLHTHDVGNIVVGVEYVGALAGLFACNVDVSTYGIQYPRNSKVDLGFVSFAMGGVRAGDTLVSSSWPIWYNGGGEFWYTKCEYDMKVSNELRSNPCYDGFFNDSTQSDQDILGEYEDTLVSSSPFRTGDPYDGRPHIPLGLRIAQRSYAWASGSASDFVIVEFEIENVGVPSDPEWDQSRATLRDLYFTVEVWPWQSYLFDFASGRQDNMVEFLGAAKSPLVPNLLESFNLVLAADNDGDPLENGFDFRAATSAFGVAVLRPPTPKSGINFNWMVRRFHNDPTRDWGPVKKYSQVYFRHGGLGTPLGDRAYYQLMSNGETDYPSAEAALDHTSKDWLPPSDVPGWVEDIADGQDVFAVMSLGPFDLPRDSSVTIAIAVAGGPDYHRDASNFREFFDPQRPDFYRSRLDRTGLLRNVQWAKWTYDNPGVDTDGDGFAGEWFLRGGDTMYYRGDGVPDIRAALPPRTPPLSFDTRSHRVAIHWNGYRTETEEDVFTQRPDFEGYRIYMSRTGREDEWSYLTQRDLLNYARFTWSAPRNRWEFDSAPFSLDSLKSLYDMLSDTTHGFPFHPDSFSVPLVEDALLEIHFDPNHPERLDSVYRYFAPYEANNQPDDVGLAMAAEAGVDVTGVVRKLSPQASRADTAYREDGTPYLPYFEYEYVVKDLQLAEPVFLSVTAFDHGDPASDLDPLETARSLNAQEIWPINDAEVVKSERPKPGVYPNPYRQIDNYFGNNWENRRGLEPDQERARQVTFYNVPDTCVVSIFSLDGDLVRRLHHSYPPGSSEATVVRWDLISRNTQAVKTGLYIWSVESRFGTDVGKLVIVK